MNQSTLLIVDDESHMREFLGTALSVNGYLVLQAANGLEALRMCGERQPQLMLLDISMPEMNGFEVLRQVRQAGKLPVVMLTTHTAENDRARAIEAGADDYLTKPFGVQDLVSRVAAVLRRSYPEKPDAGAELQVGDLRLAPRTHEVWIGADPLVLSCNEFLLLMELARHPGQAIPDRELLMTVWGPGYREEIDLLQATITLLRRHFDHDLSRSRRIVRQDSGYCWKS